MIVALYLEIEPLIQIKSWIILLLKWLLQEYHPKEIAKFKENTIGLLTEIATKRYDKLASSFLALIQLASALLLIPRFPPIV